MMRSGPIGPIAKVTENLLRRVARRQGYDLNKSRLRDPAAQHFGEYQLVNIDSGEAYINHSTGAVWMTPQTVARALDREDVLTDGLRGHVGDHQPLTPVVALKLVPHLPPDAPENEWVVESDPEGRGLSATLLLSDEKARDLADKILEMLEERQKRQQRQDG